MLKGRLGLETARIPHADRHGCIWLARGGLTVEDGTLRFTTAGGSGLAPGSYGIPFQTVSAIFLEPGTTVSHDALRLLARNGTGLVVTGEDGVRFYASLPSGRDESALARAQVRFWSDGERRRTIARRMYARRLGEILPSADLNVLRGIEGARIRVLYRTLARQFGIQWAGRNYDREDPEATDLVNQAVNHASAAIRAAAMIAVAATSTIPQLGFIHEDSAAAFCLDIADLFRESVCIPAAFRAVRQFEGDPSQPLERHARRWAGRSLHDDKVIPSMIDAIKALLGEDGSPPSTPAESGGTNKGTAGASPAS